MSNTTHFSHIYPQHLLTGMLVCVEHVQMCVYSMCVLYGMRKFNSESVYQWSAKKKLNTYKEMSCAILVSTSDAIKFPITPMKNESQTSILLI